jgi:hypothetical protein
LLILPLIQCHQHTKYKTIVKIFLACLQVRLRLFLNHLNYKYVKKIQGHLNIMKKGRDVNFPLNWHHYYMGKKSDLQWLYEIQDLVPLYIFTMTWYIYPFILFIIILRVSFCSDSWFCKILAYPGQYVGILPGQLDTQYNNDIHVILSKTTLLYK